LPAFSNPFVFLIAPLCVLNTYHTSQGYNINSL
jgi:hypothetical protein